LADAGEAFEFVNFGGVVFFAFGSGILFVGHAGNGIRFAWIRREGRSR
jgi:hypothetical protein